MQKIDLNYCLKYAEVLPIRIVTWLSFRRHSASGVNRFIILLKAEEKMALSEALETVQTVLRLSNGVFYHGITSLIDSLTHTECEHCPTLPQHIKQMCCTQIVGKKSFFGLLGLKIFWVLLDDVQMTNTISLLCDGH